MDAITLEEAAEAIQGTLFHKKNIKVSSIAIDHRAISPNCLFFAIQGDRFDGHDFVLPAYEEGAVCAVVERELATLQPYILVDNTRRALLDLAKFVRRKFSGTVVGITGSVGKTTTKEMVYDMLSQDFSTLKTEGNLNNAIGLPRTLCKLDRHYQAAVIEMGMSMPGEISALSQTARPTIGIITTIGTSHIQQLKSRENILRAKMEILDGMAAEAPLIVNADNSYLADLSSGIYFPPVASRRLITCGIENEEVQYRAVDITADEHNTYFQILHEKGSIPVHLPMIGEHHVRNALLAFAAAMEAGVSERKAAIALENYHAVGMRQNIRYARGMTIIADCYNAGPESMAASLRTLSQIPCEGRRVAVLGDMLELGDYASDLHVEVGKCAAKLKIDALFYYGNYGKEVMSGADSVPKKERYADKEELTYDVSRYLKQGDVVLFKASRGIRLETVLYDLFGELFIAKD